MKSFPRLRTFTCLLSLAVLAPSVISQRAAAQNVDGIEELTRGPVHEAFAESIAYNPEPGLIISKPAPELIEELPPEQKPVGDNIAWIPGYWAWDEEREDFVWISGVWRNVPPGRQWVPGYWADTDDRQYQWISGYWAAEDQQETAYLPPPPKSVENGPNIDAPSDNHIWVSGNWSYRDDRYAWSPGYWEPARENWIWVPGHYVWTPRGHVYVDGYWDYDVDRRGMVFAPVHFDRVVYSRPGYSYTPFTVIALEVFSHHLFVRPRYRHYYFGDYYEPRYRDSGFYASFHYHRDRRGYDPFYAHNRWRHRGDRDWDRRRNDDFEYFRDHRDARPPRTLAALLSRRDDDRRDRRDNFELARRLDRVIADRDSGRRFEKTDRRQFAERTRELRDFGRERSRLENRADDSREGRDRNTVSRERFDRSPLAVKLDQFRGNDAPPPRRETRRDDRPENNRGSEADRDRDQRPGNLPDRPMRPGSDERENRGDASRQQGRENGRDPRPETATRPGQNERDNPAQRGRGENRDEQRRETPQRPMPPNTNEREGRERPEAPAQRGRGDERGERRETPAVPQERRETPQRPQQRQETPARPQTPPRQIQEQRQQEQRQQEQNRQAQQQQAQRRQAEQRQQEQRKQAQQQQQRRQEAPEQRRQEARPQRPAAPERREVRPQENRREARPQQAPQRQQKAESRGGENRGGGGGERGGGRERKKD